MESAHLEQRHRRYQLLGFFLTLLALGVMIPVSFLLPDAPYGVTDSRLLESPRIYYASIAITLLLGALVLGIFSSRQMTYREIMDPKIQQRLQDEHERSIRYRAGFHALTTVQILQTILYCWIIFQPAFGLPILPPDMPVVITLLVAHLAFWLPYLKQTK